MNVILNRLIDIPSTDPDDARRRRLLNILLLGVAALTIAMLLISLFAVIMGMAGQQSEVLMLIGTCLGLVVGLAGLYAINRLRSGRLAGSLFLLLLIGAITLADHPTELANGRSLFIYAIPVIMASVVLKPYTSFILAAVAGFIVALLAISVDIVPNIPAIGGFFVIALVSWLSARSLEQALDDLSAINRELDKRVIDRTRDLAGALDRVQAESSKNQAILESIADGVIVFDNEQKAMVANASLSHLIEIPVDRITGSDIESLMGDRVEQDIRGKLIEFLADKGLRRAEMKFQLGNKTLSVSFAAVRSSDGVSLGTVMVMRDFTREAELERMKSALVSTASHELRTPLNAILGYSDMLKEEVYGALKDEQLKIMDRIIANTKRMLSLVNNLLDQAQIEAGQLMLTPSAFSIQELLDDVQAIMAILAEQKKIQLEFSVVENLPPILWSDPQRLHQILVNLVGNAIKFTDAGTVAIHVEQPDQNCWAIRVSDTGLGIPESAQSYIFEPFRQVDGSTTRRHAGTGLGLAIVKQLTTLLGGDISVSSEVGSGSTFTITLPLVLAEEGVA